MCLKRRVEACIDDCMTAVTNNIGVQAVVTKSARNKEFPVCELRYFIELNDTTKLVDFINAVNDRLAVCDYEYLIQEFEGGILFIVAWNGSCLHWLSNFYLEEAVVAKYCNKYGYTLEIPKENDLEVLKADWADGFIEEFKVGTISA